MSEFKAEMTSSECVTENIGSFGCYTIETKFPNALDGLKPIHRRILISIHSDPETQKVATLAGKVMKLHPHGDGAISDAISSMAQPFTHIVPLVFSNSNIGTYSGKPPAAPRYVDVCESDEAKALFYTDINPSMFRMVRSESERTWEPANFIPSIPTSLLIPIFGIAVGFQTKTMALSFADLCKLTKEYIKLRNSCVDWVTKTKSLVKYMLPDFPSYCRLRNAEHLLSSYRKGSFGETLVLDGEMKVSRDMITIETLPPGTPFRDTVLNVGSRVKIKGSFEEQNFQQMIDFTGKNSGIMRGSFRCTLRRGVNPFDVLAELKKNVQFTANWKPDCRYVMDIKGETSMAVETPLTLLNKWYEVRYSAVLGDLKQLSKDLLKEQRKLVALITIVDHTDAVYKIFRNAATPADTIIPLIKQFPNLSRMQAEYLAGLSLGQLTGSGKDDLLKRLEKVKGEQRDLQVKLGHVNDLMVQTVEKLENKYVGKDLPKWYTVKNFGRRCSVPVYVGAACYKKTGWIMLESDEEVDQVIQDFVDPEDIELHFPVNKSNDFVALGAEEDIDGTLPKYLKAGLVTTKSSDDKYTACICEKGGALVVEGTSTPPTSGMRQFIPVGKQFTAIDKFGMRTVMTVTEKLIRKNISAGPTMKDIVHVSDVIDDECIVIHGSSSKPNYLTIEHICGAKKLSKLVVGSWHVLAVLPVTNNRVYVNVPKEIRSRCVVHHLAFEKLADTIKLGEKKTCLIGRGTDSNFEIVPLRRRSTVMLAKPL